LPKKSRQKAVVLTKQKMAAPKHKKPTEEIDENEEPGKKKGRQAGAKGWSKSEANCMLDCVEKLRPTGKKAWEELAKLYNTLAAKSGFPSRTSNAIETIYKRVCINLALHY
jgi:hypothetical protein